MIALAKPFEYPASDRLGYHGCRTILPARIEARIRGMSERRTANEISAEIDDKVKQVSFLDRDVDFGGHGGRNTVYSR